MKKLRIVLPLLASALLLVSGCRKQSASTSEKKCKLTSGDYKFTCRYCDGKDFECTGHRAGKEGCEIRCKKCKTTEVFQHRITPY
jgi:hypothetical protein